MGTDHMGHRSRLRERFRRSGLESFDDASALELVLSYVLPRKDTHGIARRLVDAFGNLSCVLEATREELTLVEGIGDTCAEFLNLYAQLLRRYHLQLAHKGRCLGTTMDCGKYFVPHFFMASEESVMLLCMNSRCKVLDCRRIYRGNVNSAGVSVRKIAELAMQFHATSVALAHNHLGGFIQPSLEDRITTRRIFRALDDLGVFLVDHVVVSGDRFFSMQEDGFISELQKELEEEKKKIREAYLKRFGN